MQIQGEGVQLVLNGMVTSLLWQIWALHRSEQACLNPWLALVGFHAEAVNVGRHASPPLVEARFAKRSKKRCRSSSKHPHVLPPVEAFTDVSSRCAAQVALQLAVFCSLKDFDTI